MKEADLRSKIIKALRQRGGYWSVIHANMYQIVGLPDIIGVYRGRFYGLEVKLPGKEHTLTTRQARVLASLKASGARAKMVSSVEDAVSYVFERRATRTA